MRLSEPRVTPVEERDVDGEAKELLARTRGDTGTPRIFRTLVRHPKLLKRWMVFGNHILSKSTLPARERELLILRIGWLCRAEYEFAAHTRIGREVGLSEEELERVKQGPDAPGWSAFETTLLRAVDELHADAFITDVTWSELAARFDTQQLIDLVFTVGQYNMVSMALNSLGVQPEVPVEGFPR
ncbi:MAG: carboxymuconolactone decarboxylase family protein [Myxococcales bacterium]|nr:carboxymuconolactone decarboxylase family protein [Myxococcales bacterium]